MKDYNITNYKKEPWNGFKDYYVKMMYSGDCDPAYPALNYICDRQELNIEQRYWLAFLYATNYCVPTTFYIFNEFPDYENVNVERLQTWWDNNKQRLKFQTDRAKVKNFNLFVKIFNSYKMIVGKSQRDTFKKTEGNTPLDTYNKMYELCSQIYYFGRFSLFNYMEALNELTDLKMVPTEINWREAESSRNGLCYACNLQDFITLHHQPSKKVIDYQLLIFKFNQLMKELQEENPEINVTIWNVETVLCAWKKLFWKDRYLGYYIDRQMEEITVMEQKVKEGVYWDILWDFRKNFFKVELLGELNNWRTIRKKQMNIFYETGTLLAFQNFPSFTEYSRKVLFDSIGDVYAF